MQKLITSILILSSISSYAQEAQDICKAELLEELYRTGLITPNVCVDFENYPDFDVKMHNGKYQAGDASKEFEKADKDAVQGLMKLMSDVPEANSILQGYTDALPMGSGYDFDQNKKIKVNGEEQDHFIKGAFKKTSGPDSNKKYGIPNYTEADIADIKDKHTRERIQKHYDQWVKSGKKPIHLTSKNPFVDMLRNHALAVDRSNRYCKEFNLDCSKIDLQGAAAVLMIDENAKVDPSKKLGKDELSCPQRRGAELKFYFSDKIKEDEPTYEGEYVPRFKTTSKKLQDNIHIAGSLDMFSKMKSKDFKHPKGDLLKDPMLLDPKADRNRFKDVLSDNPGCANNEYSVDAARRMYWSVMNEIKELKGSKSGSSLSKQADALENVILNGDYSQLKTNPELKNIFNIAQDGELFTYDFRKEDRAYNKKVEQENIAYNKQITATNAKYAGRPGYTPLPYRDIDYNKISFAIDMFSGTVSGSKEQDAKLKQAYPHLKSKKDRKVFAQMVLTARALTTGRPVHSDYTYRTENALLKFEKGNIDPKHRNIFSKAPSPYHLDQYTGRYTTTLRPPPTSVFNCFDTYNAIADHITENSTDNSMLKSDLELGQEVKLDADHVNQTELINGDITKGWVCKACGSGIHVHDDGTIHIVSRDRDQNMNSTMAAESSVFSSRKDGLSMGSMLNLPTYSIPNCEGCNCLKGLSGDQLKAKLNDPKTKRHYQTKTYKDKITKYKQIKYQGKLFDDLDSPYEVEVDRMMLNDEPLPITEKNTCVFVPPVPHSCTYRPTGDSKEENNVEEIKGKLYCEIKEKLKKLPSKDYPNKPKSAKEAVEMCNKIKNNFPKPEVECYKQLKYGFSTNNGGGSSSSKVKQE